jgi:23S rRNA (guanosine2251-2'-O)-methyltransferase
MRTHSVYHAVMRLFLILHNIRSAHNVGAMFRTADGAGVERIYLTGYTPSPLDRFGREQETIKKTALGATQTVAYEVYDDVLSCIRTLRECGVAVVAVEQMPNAIPYTEYVCHGDVAFIVGNEVEGIPFDVCSASDTVVHIPMHGMKESLNVSTATGIVLFHARDGGV